MHFSWDKDKDEANQVKHGLSFETAKKVFDDPFHLSTQDRYVDGEERWQTVGMASGVMILLVGHTWLENDDGMHIRIITARKATAHERKKYENA